MITCIGTGGHSRALELPEGVAYANATPEDIMSGGVVIPDDTVIGAGVVRKT